jgi:hypothetical protein
MTQVTQEQLEEIEALFVQAAASATCDGRTITSGHVAIDPVLRGSTSA